MSSSSVHLQGISVSLYALILDIPCTESQNPLSDRWRQAVWIYFTLDLKAPIVTCFTPQIESESTDLIILPLEDQNTGAAALI
jgi:hypothetical protein